MRTSTIEVFSEATNAAVVHMPGRRFPGVVLQGDTLDTMAQSASRLRNFLQVGVDANAADEAALLVEELAELVVHYKRVLREHNLELPFTP